MQSTSRSPAVRQPPKRAITRRGRAWACPLAFIVILGGCLPPPGAGDDLGGLDSGPADLNWGLSDSGPADLRSGDLALSCAPGTEDCNGDATDGCEAHLDTDPDNCKACHFTCPPVRNGAPGCAAGACGVGSCAGTFADCDRRASNGCEIDTSTNLKNCGQCGLACLAPPHMVADCVAGKCVMAGCGKGFRDCNRNLGDGCETNIDADPANCGGCGIVCAGKLSCFRGKCLDCSGGALDFLATAAPLLVAGTSSASVAIADLNGDGRVDLAVANAGDAQKGIAGSVSVLLGAGNRTFKAAVDYPAGAVPSSIAIGDFNRDGKRDIATTNSAGANVSVLLGNGDGTFRAATNFAVGAQPVFVAVADLNGDGSADLAVANLQTGDVSVLLGKGDGAFAAAVQYAVGLRTSWIAIADLNGDGRADMAVASMGIWASGKDGSLSVLLGNGDGTFRAPVAYTAQNNPHAVAIGDLTGDGKPDLAVVGESGYSVEVLPGNGDGTFKAAIHESTGRCGDAISIGDLDGDGKADVVAANTAESATCLFAGNGDGTLRAARRYAAQSPSSVALGDLDGNGMVDLAATSAIGGVTALFGNGDATLQATRIYEAGSWPSALLVEDLDGDGAADVAIADSEHADVSVLLGIGDGTFANTAHWDAVHDVLGEAIVDLNGDGVVDLVMANGFEANSITVRLGRGDGSFGPAMTEPAGIYPQGLAIGDIDGDDLPDLVVADWGDVHDPGRVGVLLGVGDGTFWPWQELFFGPSHPSDVRLADLDGDGALDLVVGNLYGFQYYPGKGDATFAVRGGSDAGSPVAIGDLNGDGKPDLAFTTANGDSVTVRIGDGHGGFAKEVTYGGGIAAVTPAIGDLDGDGKVDLAVATAGGVGVLVGNGDGTFQAPVEFPALPTRFIAIEELSGDCRRDIVTVGGAGSAILLNTSR